jgi:hypothetical protein
VTLDLHLLTAVGLLERISSAEPLSSEYRRDLDGAMLRLRFVLDRLKES